MPGLDIDEFPEDILHHIHSLVPLRDAARAACVSRKFLRSWRCFPNLTFSLEVFGLDVDDGTDTDTDDEIAMKLVDKIHHVIGNHSGIGVKTLNLQVYPCGNVVTANHIDIWLQAAVKPGIVELAVELPQDQSPLYNFSCSLLACAATSLQSLSLCCCAFHPTIKNVCLRKLKSVLLEKVHITEEELGCFFSSATSLKKLKLSECDDITCLMIPSHLQKLSILWVIAGRGLQMIEVCAPKVTEFFFEGPVIKISIKDSSQVKYMYMNGSCHSGMFLYGQTKLHSMASNLQTLTLSSSEEAFNTPVSPDKFPLLRRLKIYCYGYKFKCFDFLSLVSFLEACPALESFFLLAGEQYAVKQNSILEDFAAAISHTRRTPPFRHDNLKKVSIAGFCPIKSLIELTCQVLENTPSLERLELDTTGGFDRRNCKFMRRAVVGQARKLSAAVKRYFKGKVPSSVVFKVWKPCNLCHM